MTLSIMPAPPRLSSTAQRPFCCNHTLIETVFYSTHPQSKVVKRSIAAGLPLHGSLVSRRVALATANFFVDNLSQGDDAKTLLVSFVWPTAGRAIRLCNHYYFISGFDEPRGLLSIPPQGPFSNYSALEQQSMPVSPIDCTLFCHLFLNCPIVFPC